MQIVYRFEIYPTKIQQEVMFYTLKLCRYLYNAALEQREICYRQRGKSIFYASQQNELPTMKGELPEYGKIQSQVLQDVLRRLDNAFKRFFSGLAGYPRFKSRDHYTSFTYPQVDNVKKTFSRPGYIFLSKIGLVKIKTHREFPIKTVSRVNVKYHGDKWYANLTTEIPDAELVEVSSKVIGIDRGLNHFAVFSDETFIDNPKYFRKTEKKLAKAQRKFSRKKKGSNNRGKAKTKVTKIHAKIANQRRDFLHKVSAQIVKKYNVIVMEDLKIRNMVRNHKLAKSIQDAGWGKFGNYIEYKCLRQGKRILFVDPKGTSQTCLCGEPVPKDLRVRVHECPVCGLVMDRDLVSAKLILERGLSAIA